MIFPCIVVLAGLIASTAATGQIAVYWGQSDHERDLAAYCQTGQGINILILAFLQNFGKGIYPNGNFAGCQVHANQSFSGCDKLSSDIATCQAAGVKVFISIGGASADNMWYLTGEDDAKNVASALWNSYANPDVTAQGSSRPFGNVMIDGWDIDIESRGAKGYRDSYKYLGDMINALRGYFASDPSRSYYISGAPQCPAPDRNMGLSIHQAQYDFLWIQFYNNFCSAADLFKDPKHNPDGHGQFNLDVWPKTVSGGASAHAQLLVGLPGGHHAAAPFDFVPVADLPALQKNASTVKGFGGFMLYDAGASDRSAKNGCTYAQQISSVLTTGKVCGSG